MHLEHLMESPLLKAAGWTVFHSLWEGAIVAAALAGVLAFTRSARNRYVAACLGLATLFFGFAVTFLVLVPKQSVSSASQNPVALGPKVPETGDAFGVPRIPLEFADLLPWVGTFWMAGVGLFYCKHLAGCLGARSLRTTGVCAVEACWRDRLDQLAARIRVSRPVTILESCLAEVPVVIGHLRPVILMPAGMLAGLPASQIELILLHELAHIRRCDYLINLLQTSAEVLLFYHPVAWWISGTVRAEREHCCDDMVVAINGNPHEYATALTALEQARWGVPDTALAATGGRLVKRIRRLLWPIQRPRPVLTPLFSAGLLVIAAAMSLTAWQASKASAARPVPSIRFVNPPPMLAQAQIAEPPLPAPQISPYTKWLNQDVVYIITLEERAAFRRLQTDEERQQFIQQFWERRNPARGSPENAFQVEHYRRIGYTNLHFPTATGVPGWKTDRGRIYIIFGPPDQIDGHPRGDAPQNVPYERWIYRYIAGIGNDVDMEFVDPRGLSEFHMTIDPDNVR